MRYFYLIIGVFVLFGCQNSTQDRSEPLQYIPQSAQAILKIKQWEITQREFIDNEVVLENVALGFKNLFKDKDHLFNNLKTKNTVILCAHPLKDSVAQFSIITSGLNLEGIDGLKKENKTLNKEAYLQLTYANKISYAYQKDSITIIATQQNIIEEVINKQFNDEKYFQKALKVKNNKPLALTKVQDVVLNEFSNKILFSVASYELELLPDGIRGQGIALDKDSIKEILQVFKEQIPQKNNAAQIISLHANQALAFTYSDVKKFESALNQFNNTTNSFPIVLETINEIVQIKLNTNYIVGLKSLDQNLSWDHLAKHISQIGTFREVTLYELAASLNIAKSLAPLLADIKYNVVFEWEDFIIFSENKEAAEAYIAILQSNNTLQQSYYFESYNNQMAQSSSYITYQFNVSKASGLSTYFEINNYQKENYPLSIFQFIKDRDFAHLNFICKSAKNQKNISGGVQEVLSVTLESPILGFPQFFSNHQTKGRDIVVQDQKNTLYFISNTGKVLWKQKLDSPILGEINEIDLFRNGKKQLIFSTQKNLYILDRNGNPVAPFPKKFNNPITQPLAVFDYDNNRKYRFLVCQKNEVIMLDGTGKIVNGFTFKKASSKIVLPPKHIKIGNKDYITVAEEKGKLHILSRTGSERIKVNKKFTFGLNNIEKLNNSFTLLTKDGQKVTISTEGKISTTPLENKLNYFKIEGNTQVALNENLLRINKTLIELPLGNYSSPTFIKEGNITFVAITETNENKLYLYNGIGNLVANFPVFGSGKPTLYYLNKNTLQIIVSGDQNEVLYYELKI